MKNANIFVDVDLTLINERGELLPGAREALEKLQARGCHLFLWSSCGVDYCRTVAETHKLSHLFEGFSSKPDIVIDDMPGTCVAPFTFDVHKEPSWVSLADDILRKHID